MHGHVYVHRWMSIVYIFIWPLNSLCKELWLFWLFWWNIDIYMYGIMILWIYNYADELLYMYINYVFDSLGVWVCACMLWRGLYIAVCSAQSFSCTFMNKICLNQCPGLWEIPFWTGFVCIILIAVLLIVYYHNGGIKSL